MCDKIKIHGDLYHKIHSPKADKHTPKCLNLFKRS